MGSTISGLIAETVMQRLKRLVFAVNAQKLCRVDKRCSRGEARRQEKSYLYRVPGSTKTGHKENSSTLKNALWKPVLLQSVLGKFVVKISDRFFGKTIIRTDISEPLSIASQCHYRGCDHNAIIMVGLATRVTFLAPLVHTDLLLSDFTPTPNNRILSRYLTWLGDFN